MASPASRESRSFICKSQDLEDQILRCVEAGFCHKAVNDRCNRRQNPFALCSDKNAQDPNRGETEINCNSAPMHFVNKHSVRMNFQCEGKSLGFTGIECRIGPDHCRDNLRRLNPNPIGESQTGKASGGSGKSDILGLNGGRNHNLMEDVTQHIPAANKREIKDDRSVRDNNHTPRIRSIAARSSCRSLTE